MTKEEKLDRLDERLFDILVDYNEVLELGLNFDRVDHTELIINARQSLIEELRSRSISDLTDLVDDYKSQVEMFDKEIKDTVKKKKDLVEQTIIMQFKLIELIEKEKKQNG